MVEEIKDVNMPEVSESNDDKETSGNALSDYKAIIEVIKEMDSGMKMLESMVESSLRDKYGLKFEIVDNILQYTKEDIPNMEADTIFAILTEYSISVPNPNIDDLDHAGLIEVFLDVKDSSLSILSSREEVAEVKKDSSDTLHEYFTYLSSDKVKDARKARLEKMEKLYEDSADTLEKSKLKKQIDILKQSFSFDFIKERLAKIGDKEVKSILEACYGRGNSSSYIISKYESKAKGFGYSKDSFKSFFNIEDDFLPDEYKPMNNLFLFIYMRFVAHSDPHNKNDKLLVYSLTSALSDLKYHRFSQTSEVEFVNVIKEVLNYFMPHIEYIKEKNLGWREHPVNIERVKEMRIAAIAKLGADIKRLDKDYIIPDDVTVEELKNKYDELKAKMTESQVKSYNAAKKEQEKKDNESDEEADDEIIVDSTSDNVDDAEDTVDPDHIQDPDDGRYVEDINDTDTE